MTAARQSESEKKLVESAKRGDEAALAALFERYRERLVRLVSFRLDPRLRRRVSAADVVQETFLVVRQKIQQHFDPERWSFFLWARLEIGQKLIEIHRFHLGAQMRDASRDVSIYWGGMPLLESSTLAEQLIGRMSTASNAAMRAELTMQVQQALDEMDPQDREMLVLRHFEELSNLEASQVLGISHSAACNRHIRALQRLRKVFEQLPGGLEGIWP